jgi:hypothetical protein
MHIAYAIVHGFGNAPKEHEKRIMEEANVTFDNLPTFMQEEIIKTSKDKKWTN